MSERLTLEQVMATQEYAVLTGKQQSFVENYIEGGLASGIYDAVAATQMAYATKSREIARVMSYALITNIRIIAVLNRHFNKEPLAEFVEQVDRAIRNKKLTTAQLLALKLKGDVLGYTTYLPGTPNFPRGGAIPPAIVKAVARKSPRKKSEPKPDAAPIKWAFTPE
jgi:hypothetical protein